MKKLSYKKVTLNELAEAIEQSRGTGKEVFFAEYFCGRDSKEASLGCFYGGWHEAKMVHLEGSISVVIFNYNGSENENDLGIYYTTGQNVDKEIDQFDGSNETYSVERAVVLYAKDHDLPEELYLEYEEEIKPESLTLPGKYYDEAHGVWLEEGETIGADEVVMPDGTVLSEEVALAYMDDDLYERVRSELAPCLPQVFLDRYCELHKDKFGEEFVIN